MVVIRASTILAAAGTARPRAYLGASALIIHGPGRIPTSKGVIIKNMPYWADIVNAPEGLLAVWEKFGSIAAQGRGGRGRDEFGLTSAASAVKRGMSPTGITGTGIGRPSKMGTIRALLASRGRVGQAYRGVFGGPTPSAPSAAPRFGGQFF